MSNNTVLSKISLDDAMWIKQNHYFEENNRTETIKSESFDKGLAKGLSQGRAEGLHDKAIETAKNLLKMGILTTNQIAEVTNLSPEEIKKLK